ncbi:MAG: 1-acyl-sn-glycerol-3-phosphate acyltransferase [Lachnospiraceae bacterium]|nr:1-acyl-sn-glycerol-3-phosphate acyltransferase [Lachnospiraceae bacterium]
MLRAFFCALEAFLYLLLGLPFLGIYWIIGKFNKPLADRLTFKSVQWIFKIIYKTAGAKVKVIGMENIPKDTPVLYIANHLSLFDIVITYALCPGVTGYIAKDNLKKIPILPLWFKRTYGLFLNRDNIKEGLKVITEAIETVKSGAASIFIFPEGTRSKTGEIGEFKGGSFKIATRSGCPIIPVCIKNTDKIATDRGLPFKKADVTVTYLPPVYPELLDMEKKKHIGDYVKGLIAEELRKENEDE